MNYKMSSSRSKANTKGHQKSVILPGILILLRPNGNGGGGRRRGEAR